MAGRNAPPPPITSFNKVLTSLKKEKHKFTIEESATIAKCNNRSKTYCLEGLFAGIAVWSATGRWKLMQRLIATLAGATAGAVFMMNLSRKPCIEDILALEGSIMRERFAATLQKDFGHKRQVRTLLEKYYYIEPLYDDSVQDTPGAVLRKRDSAGVGFEKPSREAILFGEDSDLLQNVNKASTTPKELVEPASKTLVTPATINNLQRDEALEDLFEMLEGELSNPAINGKASREHKARMGVLERREHNRARYLQWQEKQNASGSGDPQAELGSSKG